MGSKWLTNLVESPGVQIWKIDNKSQELTVVQKRDYGVFRSDDCYVLFEMLFGDRGAKTQNIIVWVGKTSVQEEYTNTMADDLEQKLASKNADNPTQQCTLARSREVQEHESDYFQSLFKFRGGIQYVEPVVLSHATNLREDAHTARLYHLKGRRNVRVKQVEVARASLNSGDVFVLDMDNIIYQWNGSKAGRMEKAKGLDLTVRLRDERMNRTNAKVVLLEEGKEDDAFWIPLGGAGPVATADEGGDDAEFEKSAIDDIKLFKVVKEEKEGSEEAEYRSERVDTHGKHLHVDMLDSNHTFIVDSGTELFVWTGKDSPLDVRQKAMKIATSFLSQQGRPNWTPVTKAIDGHESALFKGKFHGTFKEFVDNPEQLALRTKAMSRTALTKQQEEVNVDAMHHPERYSATKGDDVRSKLLPPKPKEGTGIEVELVIWIMKGNGKELIPKDEHGIFYSGESYVILYSVPMPSGDKRHVVYFWQGRQSKTEDKGHAALIATDVAKECGSANVTQVQVTQNKEPEHFLAHFEGSMNIRRGRREAWLADWGSKPKLFHVRGTSSVDTRAVQMKTEAAALNSNDAFILTSNEHNWVWMGKGANQFEREMAISMTSRLIPEGQTYDLAEEGLEPDTFWNALGGKGQYSSDDSLTKGDIRARLFQCSDASSTFKVMEIYHFVQDDLDNTDVMILDGITEVFVWIGSDSTDREKSMAKETAHRYLKAADDGRPSDVPIYVVNAREEPPQFAKYFHGWDEAAAKAGEDLYARTLKRMADSDFFKLSSDATAEIEAVQKVKATFDKSDEDGGAVKPKSGNAPVRAASSVKTTTPSSSSSTTLKKAASVKAEPSGSPAVRPDVPTYPIEKLRSKPLPEGVDQDKLENYLSDDDFLAIFKMDYASFAAAPKWKQLGLKKDAKLF